MRSAFLFFHRWLGLSLALLISFLGLSGTTLVFRPELDARLNAPLLLVTLPRLSKVEQVSWQSMYEEVQARYPKSKISLVFAARTPRQTHEFWLNKGRLRVYVNPYTGAILGDRSASLWSRTGFFLWLYEAHTHLFVGEVGEQIAGWSGLALAALALSGLVLWFPRRRHLEAWQRALGPQLNTNWRGRVFELHRAGGFYLAGFLLLSGLTGAALVWPDATSTLVKGIGITQTAKVKAKKGSWQSLDALVAKANRRFPQGSLIRLTFPAKSGAPLVIRKRLSGELHPNGMNNIALDPVTGRVLFISDSRRARLGDRWMNLRYPLHTGRWAGNFSRFLATLVGLCPLLFSLSGFLMWRARSSKRKGKRQST